MNKELATVYRQKIQHLPFIGIISGLVYTLSMDMGGDTKVVKRFPASYDTNDEGNPCFTNPERDLVPDNGKKSVIYFEDNGLSQVIRNNREVWQSRIRLICWLNRSKLTGNTYTQIAGAVMSEIIYHLKTTNPQNTGIFKRLETVVANIPAVDPALFGRYTYDETVKQYLMPPYDYFAVDLVSYFEVPFNCMEGITWTSLDCQE
jgi:hypothetical protein